MTPNPFAVQERGPREVRCPWCNAAEKMPCTVDNGPRAFIRRREVSWYHESRIEAWGKCRSTTSDIAE